MSESASASKASASACPAPLLSASCPQSTASDKAATPKSATKTSNPLQPQNKARTGTGITIRALSLRPIKLNNLPRKAALITEAFQLLSSSLHWKPHNKSYNGIQPYVQTIPTITSSTSSSSSASLFRIPSHPSTSSSSSNQTFLSLGSTSAPTHSTTPVYAADGSGTPYTTDTPWYCVSHEFPSAPPPNTNSYEPIPTLYTHLWSKMSQDRISNQQLYTPEITSITDIKTLSRTQSVWSISYDFGSPLSPRVFTMLQIIKLIDTIPGSRTGLILTLPINLTTSHENLSVLEDLGVKARCITIEHLKEYNGGTIIEWRKIMCMEFGGLVPRFVVKKSMPERIALEATRFLQWIIKPEDTRQLQLQREQVGKEDTEVEEENLRLS